jgi:cyanophycinase
MRFLMAACFFVTTIAAQSAGPTKGTLFVVGGGKLGPELVDRFLTLAGGPASEIVYIPTADDKDEFPGLAESNFLTKAGATKVKVLHTRDKTLADTDAFVAPLRSAQAVWFAGGRQWRLVDSYLGTKVQKELAALLKRGGVIGGTSAGATILGSFLVRGARSGNTIMIDPVYQSGMGFLRGVAVDQHLIARKRERDMLEVVGRYPKLLGLGIDESTAVVVRGDRFEVIGASKVAVYEHGKDFYWLSPGDRFDLKARRQVQ